MTSPGWKISAVDLILRTTTVLIKTVLCTSSSWDSYEHPNKQFDITINS